jgi:putative CocE/NonD family hydrolase
MLADYVALRAGGTPVWVRIGAGGHIGGGGEGGMTDAPLRWFDTHLKGMSGLLPERTVTLEVLGEGGGWRDFDAWPPPATPTPWFLQPGGALSLQAPTGTHLPDHYRYDPADPTPSVGGIGMLTGGSRDNRELEARPDVLVFTSDALDRALEIVGPVRADLHVSSSIDNTDFFVRVCDVYPDGRSLNVCDGLQRFTPSTIARAADGSFRASVAMWPTAYRFGAGHRVRVQVSSGAHPVYARNLGTGESVLTATSMVAADQSVFHDSSVVLPHA